MWDNGTWDTGDWIAMSLMMVAFWGLLIVAVVAFIRWSRRDAATPRRLHKTQRVYEREASTCARSRRLWIRQAGSAAEATMLSDLAATLRPGARVLDAVCGGGPRGRPAGFLVRRCGCWWRRQ